MQITNVVHPLAQGALTALDMMGARANLGYSYTHPHLCPPEGPCEAPTLYVSLDVTHDEDAEPGSTPLYEGAVSLGNVAGMMRAANRVIAAVEQYGTRHYDPFGGQSLVCRIRGDLMLAFSAAWEDMCMSALDLFTVYTSTRYSDECSTFRLRVVMEEGRAILNASPTGDPRDLPAQVRHCHHVMFNASPSGALQCADCKTPAAETV